MELSFHGAARTVTGSKHLIKLQDGTHLLLDCGFFQGHGKMTDVLNRHFGFEPSQIDYLILSHAHIDHSGAIPLLYKQGFRGKIISTSATRDLAAIMLADTAHIMMNDVKYLNKHLREKRMDKIEVLYSQEDVDGALELFHTVPYNKPFRINKQAELLFTDAGHILGAAAVNLTLKENGKEFKLTFTGDIGRSTDQILPAPQPFPQADYIICESTYGNRLHENAEMSAGKLLEIVHRTCVEQKGKVIIPAFSLGRTQEIVYTLNNLSNAGKLPKIPVYVDSPLSINATNIMRMHRECFNSTVKSLLKSDPDPFGFDNLHYIQRVEDSMALNNRKEPMIIISASGMAEAGRIKHHIKNNILNPANTILIVGYCTPDSLGGRLTAGHPEVRIFGKEYQVKASVEVLGSYSAHADYNEMLNYLKCQNPEKVKKMFLVHGEYEVQVEWREKLMAAGFSSIEIPEQHSTWEVEG